MKLLNRAACNRARAAASARVWEALDLDGGNKLKPVRMVLMLRKAV